MRGTRLCAGHAHGRAHPLHSLVHSLTAIVVGNEEVLREQVPVCKKASGTSALIRQKHLSIPRVKLKVGYKGLRDGCVNKDGKVGAWLRAQQ